jgi:hypothetical protein
MNVMMRSWVRFNNSIYKDESYLTHTLPVTKNDIYNSKFIQALLFFIFSFIVIIISLFIAYYSEEVWLGIKTAISAMASGLDINVSLFVIGFILVVFLEVFNAIQCGFFGIILGYRKNNNKIAFSVIFGFIIYLVAQSIVLLLVFIVGLFDKSIMDLFKSTILLDTNSFKLLIILSIVIYTSIILIMSIICKKVLNKGVNIE